MTTKGQRTMEPAAAYEQRNEVEFVDVREDDEWAAGHIDGARHIPLDRLEMGLGALDPERRVVTVCRSGGRSDKAAGVLRARGYRVENLDGGMHAWAAAGLPFRSSDGEPARVA